MSSKEPVGVLALVGITLIVAGGLYRLLDEGALHTIKRMFWIEDTAFLNVMDIMHNIIPIVMIVVGIFCVLVAAKGTRSEGVVEV